MDNKLIVLAGATGNLGGRIARALLQRGAGVIALVRHGSAPGKVEELRTLGATIAEVDFSRLATVTGACSGASCVVSALSGLREVNVDSQTLLFEAALEAGVQRFIPSDYCIDFTKLPPGTNRNLDLRREFRDRVDGAPLAATSIFNGAFTEMRSPAGQRTDHLDRGQSREGNSVMPSLFKPCGLSPSAFKSIRRAGVIER